MKCTSQGRKISITNLIVLQRSMAMVLKCFWLRKCLVMDDRGNYVTYIRCCTIYKVKDIVSGSQGSGIGFGGRTVERNTTTSYQKLDLESVSVGITATIVNSAIHAISDCIVVLYIWTCFCTKVCSIEIRYKWIRLCWTWNKYTA